MKRTLKAAAPAIGLFLAVFLIGACGSDDEPKVVVKPPLSVATADRLASLSDRIATDLDSGDTCDAAYVADQLQDAVESANLSATLRPGVEEVATRLVDEVNCPPPPPEPKKKKKEEEKKKQNEGKHGHGDKGGEGSGPGPPGLNGGLPPGQAKLEGEAG